jgi:alpha-tubulin suppressor-like RCC1 family protein
VSAFSGSRRAFSWDYSTSQMKMSMSRSFFAAMSVTAALVTLMSGCRELSTDPRTRVLSPADSVVALSPREQDTVVGVALRLGVQVLDRASKPSPNLTVVFIGPTPAYPTYNDRVLTDQDGKAYVNWSMPTRAGSYTISAMIWSTPLQVSFQVRVNPGAPTQLVPTTVLTQAAAAGATLHPGVIVEDRFSNPIPGAPVSFTIGGTQGGGVEHAAVVANDSGVAAPGAWTIGTDPGKYTLTAIAGSGALQPTIAFGARVNPTFAVTVLAAGQFSGCAIAARATSGTYCWGNGFDPARFGFPGSNDSLPAPIANAPALVSLGVGQAHACGLTNDGTAYCWGNNWRGQAGISDNGGVVTVAAVAGQHQFRQLVAGREFTCGLALDGAAWCWGHNSLGELGDATGRSSATPVRVADDHVFTSLTAGDRHACGLTAAAVAWCWGLNDRGQLGTVAPAACQDTTGDFYFGGYTIAAVSCALAPARAAVAPPLASISASNITCGLGTDGTVVCWGISNQPQLTTIVAPEPLIQIAASGFSVCALSRSGAVYCGSATPLARAGPSVAARFITAGLLHQCAISSDGIAYCWGSNDAGQLGNGTHAPATAALPVAAP